MLNLRQRDQRTDQWMDRVDRGDCLGPPRVNPGSKNWKKEFARKNSTCGRI